MQKIRVFLLFVLLARMCIPLHAQWTARSTSQSGGDTITELSGTSGRTARVISASSLTGAETALIGNCLDAVWALPGIQGREASVRIPLLPPPPPPPAPSYYYHHHPTTTTTTTTTNVRNSL